MGLFMCSSFLLAVVFIRLLVVRAESPVTLLRPTCATLRGRDVVLVMANGPRFAGTQGAKWVARFGGSFRRVNEAADVVFFTQHVDEAIAPLVASVRMVPHVFSSDPRVPLSRVKDTRWGLFLALLEARSAAYSRGWVLAVDASDTFFQRDPFRLVEWAAAANASVLGFLEQSTSIRESSWTASALASCYVTSELAGARVT